MNILSILTNDEQTRKNTVHLFILVDRDPAFSIVIAVKMAIIITASPDTLQ
jgi:hypothetical protein